MRRVKYKEIIDPKYKYQADGTYKYYSRRYNRTLTLYDGFKSDGATGAMDIDSDAWWFHDVACENGKWDDGTFIDNWTASTLLGDILWEDGYRWRAVYWWWATYLFGGGEARKNGMRRVLRMGVDKISEVKK